MSIIRIASAVVIMACVALPARAKFITYEFIEANSTTVGGILTIASPPAFPDKPWATSNNGDLLGFEITDPMFIATGAYTPALISTVGSLTGARLSLGDILGNQGLNKAQTDISSLPGQSFLSVSYTTGNSGGENSVFGDWVVVNLITIPEPSLLVLSAIASLTGLGMWLGGRASRIWGNITRR